MRAKRSAILVAGLVLLFHAPSVETEEAAPARFAGLERLYFERVEDLAAFAGHCAAAIERRLPRRLDEVVAPVEEDPWAEPSLCDDYRVRDVPLPLGAPVTLRELIDFNHPRIHGQYWCLYTQGVRGDCWFFSPTPTRAEGKLLSALRLEDAVALGPDVLRLRAHGTMVRPMGGWWTRGAELTFAVAAGEIRYLHALLPFTVIQPYDNVVPTGELDEHGDQGFDVVVEPPSVASERLDEAAAGARRVVRSVVPAATGEILARCGIDDLRETSGSFDDWQRLAACITADETAEVTTRALDEPVFVEVGGTPDGANPR